MGPRRTSRRVKDPKYMIPPAMLPMKQPNVTPHITGQPKRAAKGRRLSAILNCTGPNDIGAKATERTEYKPATRIAKLILLVLVISNLLTRGL